MTFSEELRWRAVILYSFMGYERKEVAELLGVSPTSVKDWTGHVYSAEVKLRTPGWRIEVQEFVLNYVQEHPCFILEELQMAIRETFEDLRTVSIPTVCRALRHDLKLSRKKLEKRAREAIPQELEDFKYCRHCLSPFYNFPEQLVFVDETSKDGRSAPPQSVPYAKPHRHYRQRQNSHVQRVRNRH